MTKVVAPRQKVAANATKRPGGSAAQCRVAQQAVLTGPPRIRVKVKAPTRYKESVFLTGGAPELGEWDVDRGIALQWAPGHIWHGQIELHSLQTEIKFVRKHELQPITDWQSGANILLERCENGLISCYSQDNRERNFVKDICPFQSTLAFDWDGGVRAFPNEEPFCGRGDEIVLQGFSWESWKSGGLYHEIAWSAELYARAGFSYVWLPPPAQSVSPEGYMPSEIFNLNSEYGSVHELRSLVYRLNALGIRAMCDTVINHRCGDAQDEEGVWNHFTGKASWGPWAITQDSGYKGTGEKSSGEVFHAAPNIDHSNEMVKNDIRKWFHFLRNDIGFDGFRLDFCKGYSGKYVEDYMFSVNPMPTMCVGEYWTMCDYEGGKMKHDQNRHRNEIAQWCNTTGGVSAAFDFTTKGILQEAIYTSDYSRLADSEGRPAGLIGIRPSHSATFIENHDTGSTQQHWPFPYEHTLQGYAYILTHPGTPYVFIDHFHDAAFHEAIVDFMWIRREEGIHCRSEVKIITAQPGVYVACIDDRVYVRLGDDDWELDDEDYFLRACGPQYAIWVQYL